MTRARRHRPGQMRQKVVTVLPLCLYCADGTPATMDARDRALGWWTEMCDTHYRSMGKPGTENVFQYIVKEPRHG